MRKRDRLSGVFSSRGWLQFDESLGGLYSAHGGLDGYLNFDSCGSRCARV